MFIVVGTGDDEKRLRIYIHPCSVETHNAEKSFLNRILSACPKALELQFLDEFVFSLVGQYVLLGMYLFVHEYQYWYLADPWNL